MKNAVAESKIVWIGEAPQYVQQSFVKADTRTGKPTEDEINGYTELKESVYPDVDGKFFRRVFVASETGMPSNKIKLL